QFDHVHLRRHARQRDDLRPNPSRRIPDSQVHGQTPHIHNDPDTHPRPERPAAGDVRGVMVTRREVVSALASVSGLTTLGIPVAAAQTPGRRPDLRLQKGEKLVMIGDSITDVGRARPIGEGRADDALGRGYVMMVDALLGAVYPERLIRLINMGVSGNTTRDLKARWQKDVLDLKPDWLSIMIGANDVWRQYDSPKQTERHVLIDEYERNLVELVSSTKPAVKGLILMTPYYIEPNRQDAM